MNNQSFEVIIIGGGPAGMSSALVLGRSRIRTLLLSTEQPRNRVTTHSHGFLTQDGKHPAEILAVAKQQLARYEAVSYRLEKALQVKRQGEHFLVESKNGSYSSRRLIIATGHTDHIAAIGIPGLTEVYGRSVYPCPFCDGYELADKPLAVIGDAMMAPMFAKTIFHWSEDVMVFTNGETVTDQEIIATLQQKGIRIVEEKIRKLHSRNGQLTGIELEDGSLIEREGGFLPDTQSVESTDFARQLQVPTEIGEFAMESYVVNEQKETELKGLFIIGDARTGWSGIASSVAEGSEVAATITHQLIEENWAP